MSMAEQNGKSAESVVEDEDEKKGEQQMKPGQNGEEPSESTSVGVKVEREEIDPSRYVVVVENNKKTEADARGGESSGEAGKKRERRGRGPKKKTKNLICDICREQADDEHQLELHRRSKHINEKSEFFCDFCLKIFKTKAILKGHRYKHVTDPQFLCVRCGKKYFTISNLNEHSLYCLDEKKFQCPVCHKKFNVNKQFKRHLVIHEADRYIKCTVCDQTFSRKDNYRQHFRRHTGEKPYTCDICGKSFRIKATYNYHRRTHRDVRSTEIDSLKLDGSKERDYLSGFEENAAFPLTRNADFSYGRDGCEKNCVPHLNDPLQCQYTDNFLRKETYQH